MLLKYLNEGYTPKDDSEETYFIDAGYVVVNKDNIDSYAGDLEEVTQGILDSLTTDYLKK